MAVLRERASFGLMFGVSALALVAPQGALAQPTPAPDPAAPGDQSVSPAQADAKQKGVAPAQNDANAIVITGIRASLQRSMDIKKNAIGVVDAISAEEMGKFPDTNLAEALQRITGVSIDRSNGEGQYVTVRGFGPEFNLVLLNGRQMPASSLGADCCNAPASRSFDFANLAAEGISAVEVYKSGRVSLPTGGIGSTINILTPRPLDRPGFRATVTAKGVIDTSRFRGKPVTPEVSGIVSDTFADNRIGILATGSYQRRKASVSQFSGGWREGYLGNENNWESLAVDANDWRSIALGKNLLDQITNRPGPTDVYQVPQNAGYDFTDIDRERINGQLVLQARPTDSLTATVDYTFSQNTVKGHTSSIGVWFNGFDTTSSWTDGPAAGPLFYSEHFGPGKDLAITGAISANRSINHSLGGNLAWHGLGGLRFTLDAHHSTAESKPTTPYGSNIAIGSAIFGVENQTVDYDHDLPVISVDMYPGSELDNPANIRPAGNAFRNAYMKDRINEASLKGGYDFDASFIKSLDFGVTLTDNKVRSAFGNLQNDTWGGTLSAADTPDDLYHLTPLPPDLKGMSGYNDPSIIPYYYQVDTTALIKLLESKLNICSHPIVGTAEPGTCLAKFTVDRRIDERTIAPYISSLHEFSLFDNPAILRFGLRYERTRVSSSALVPVPTGTSWVADNEIAILYGGSSDFTTLKGKYHNWLPEVDFDMSPVRNVKLRASYSHTITRPDYASMQGGLTLAAPIRVGGGTGSTGNPGLLPYKSKNIDLSAEWYYGKASYASIGFFHKNVSNFISNSTAQGPAFGLTNPAAGPLVDEARAALGPSATTSEIRAYIIAHHPEVVDPATGGILGTANDPLVNFVITHPTNSDLKAKLWGWEFNIQHSFWNTGFGTILNYTIVKSDTKYNNALHYLVPQFAVTGVSDSANAVFYYDKNGIQARVAYNWRGGFLAGYGFDPFYIEAYGQVDANASYEFRKGMTVFVEGINITNADRRGHMRNNHIVTFAQPGHARYSAGIRVTF
jgi:TonB-dependent receptor